MTPAEAAHPNTESIRTFYTAFSSGDYETMAELYSPRVRFDDPVFSDLDYDRVTAMWRMFCTGEGNLDISFGDVRADDRRGSAHWEAIYRFPPTGRRVHNKIDAEFEFEDGAVVRHRDHFSFYRWAKMALPAGALLGWTPPVRTKVRTAARAQLERFMAELPGE